MLLTGERISSLEYTGMGLKKKVNRIRLIILKEILEGVFIDPSMVELE
jgi:hypothetical protein